MKCSALWVFTDCQPHAGVSGLKGLKMTAHVGHNAVTPVRLELETKGLWVRASPASLHCVLHEQDTLIIA